MSEEVIFTDMTIERKILKSFFLDVEKSTKNFEYFLQSGLDVNAFTGVFRTHLFTMITEHHRQFSSVPSISIVWIKFKRKYKQREKLEEAEVLLEKVLKAKYEEQDRAFLITELKQMYWLRSLAVVHSTGLTYLNQVKYIGKDDIKPEKVIRKMIDDLTLLLSSKVNQIREGDIFKDQTVLQELLYKRDFPSEAKGIDTGIPVLTQVTNGWSPGELILVSGRPGQGKSVLLSNFAYKGYVDRNNVLVFSLEMPFRQQQYRVFSQSFNIPYVKIKNPQYLTQDEVVVMAQSLNKHSKEKNYFFVVDAPERCTVQFIDNKISELENKYGISIDLVVIDPIYLMRTTESDRRNNDDPTGMISGEVKLLAMKRSIPILAATQINRSGGARHNMGKEPDAMDLSFSDRLAHNSDMIFIITSDHNDLAQLHIVKFRDGAGPRIILRKNFSLMQFNYSDDLNDQEEINKYIKHLTII